ncbi:MAG: hypothetical protein R3B94_06785 [Hyphomonas sp.]
MLQAGATIFEIGRLSRNPIFDRSGKNYMKQSITDDEARNANLLKAVELLMTAPEADKVHSIPARNLLKVSVYKLSSFETQTREELIAACERILSAYETELDRESKSRKPADVRDALDDIRKLCQQLQVKLSALSEDEYRVLLGSRYLKGSVERDRIDLLIGEIGWDELRPLSWQNVSDQNLSLPGTRLSNKIGMFGEIASFGHAYMVAYN